MALRRTHYEVLGVAPDASSVDIAAAYRDKLHEMKAKPDAAPETLAALREAYQALANPARREEYDRTLQAAMPRRAQRAAPAPDPDSAHSEGFTDSAWFKIGVPVAIIAIAWWGWKASHRPARPPEARVVSVQTVVVPAPSMQPQPADDAESAVPPQARMRVAAQAPAPQAAPARSAEDVFANVSGSIARVFTADATDRLLKQGSGVVVGPGTVVTNCHVVKGGSRITVKVGSETFPASVEVQDELYDLCRLDVRGLEAPPVDVGSVDDLHTGQRVYAIGAPMGLELTISEGIVSSLRAVDEGKVIQTTAPVSPGSSGGGLFTTGGRLVGVVTFQSKYGQNLNFAVPADWISDMRSRGPGGTQLARAEPTVAEMVVGRWWCFGSISGRNGEYTYGSDGSLHISAAGERDIDTEYLVKGRRIYYRVGDSAIYLDIESITQDHLVQLVGGGQRLACDRR